MTLASRNTFLLSVLACCLTLVFTQKGQTQVEDFDLRKELSRHSLMDIRADVEAFVASRPNSAEALYLEAVLRENAQLSLEAYNQLKNRFPTSPLSAHASYRLGHYYIARGLYVAARRFFLELVETYPSSGLIPDAVYFAAASLCASKQEGGCLNEMKNFLQQYPGSYLSKMAREDLKMFGGSAALELAKQNKDAGTGKYTLQLGAFKPS